MIRWEGVHLATFGSLLIEAMCVGAGGSLVVSHTGTGFIYRLEGATFLVTNWHIVTGRNPDHPLQMIGAGHDSPVRLNFCLPLKSNRNRFLPGGVDLYTEGKPIWLEMRPVNGRIDLIAIKINFQEDAFVVSVQDFASIGGDLSIGSDVVVVGFPFGRYGDNPHAIWKRAMVASEPGILLSGRPRYFIDVAGRPGMSGSPVYATSLATRVAKRTYDAINNPKLSLREKIERIKPEDFMSGESKSLSLIGIYSGALAENGLRDLSLGFCWHAGLLSCIFKDLMPGYNPEPPQLG